MEPPVEFAHTAVELVGNVIMAEELDRPERVGGQLFGIGLRFLA